MSPESTRLTPGSATAVPDNAATSAMKPTSIAGDGRRMKKRRIKKDLRYGGARRTSSETDINSDGDAILFGRWPQSQGPTRLGGRKVNDRPANPVDPGPRSPATSPAQYPAASAWELALCRSEIQNRGPGLLGDLGSPGDAKNEVLEGLQAGPMRVKNLWARRNR